MPDPKMLLFAILAVFLIIWGYVVFLILKPWLRSFMSGGKVSVLEIAMTRMRKNPVNLIVDAYLSLQYSGFKTTYATVEKHYIVYRSKIITSTDLVLSVQQDSLDANI
ncbi:MAG: hypothetical protein ABJZ55_08475 [Fuerstiella sp.]